MNTNAYEQERAESNLVDALRSPALLTMHAVAKDVSPGLLSFSPRVY